MTGGVAGIAIGEAASVALDPAFEPVKQDAWAKKPTRILDEGQLAQLVAQALNAVSDVIDDVNRNGFASDEFAALVQLALKAPGTPDAEKLYLRAQGKYPGAITLAELNHAYGKAGLENQWWAKLTAAAQNTLLTPAELALGVVRSTVPDSGLLIVTLDTAGSNVAKYPVATLNTLDEFAAAGFDQERARVLVGSVGLPMAVELAARATYRNILTKGAYYQAVLEGDTRPEWADSIFEVAKQIPTAEQFLENYLRGYTQSFQTALDNAALHGMSATDATLVFQNMGRPLAIHQITTGLSRGGVFQPQPGEVQDPYQASVRESNIKPAYYDLAIANKYQYPPLFQTVSMLKAGTVSPDIAAQWLLHDGYEPTAVGLIVDAYATPASTTNTHLKSAQTSLVTATRKAYLGGSITPAQAQTALSAAGVPAATQAQMLDVWNANLALEQIVTPPAPIIAPPGGG